MNPDHEAIVMTLKLEESVRLARLDAAERAYAASLARLFTWQPGDHAEMVRILADALGDAQHLIACLKGE